MRSSDHNRGNISSLIGGKVLNFGVEIFFIVFLLNITTNIVISQIKLLRRHHFSTLLLWVVSSYTFFHSVRTFVFCSDAKHWNLSPYVFRHMKHWWTYYVESILRVREQIVCLTGRTRAAFQCLLVKQIIKNYDGYSTGFASNVSRLFLVNRQYSTWTCCF